MKNKITVSVYITTQNRPDLLDRALYSLSLQSFKDFEVLICNDASDNFLNNKYNKIIENYKTVFNNVEYIVNNQVKGACYSRNLLLSMSSGMYVTGLDDDDAFHKDRLSIFVDFMKKNIENYSFICSGVDSLQGFSKEIDIKSRMMGNIIDFNMMKKMNYIGNQIFIKKEIIKDIGGFDNEMPAWQDYDTWFRIIQKHGSAFKLNVNTMLLDSDENRVRISTSSKAHNGYKKFIEKHYSCLNEEDLISLKYMDLINRKESFSILNRELIKNRELFFRVLKYKSVYDHPNLFKLYKKFLQKR